MTVSSRGQGRGTARGNPARDATRELSNGAVSRARLSDPHADLRERATREGWPPGPLARRAENGLSMRRVGPRSAGRTHRLEAGERAVTARGGGIPVVPRPADPPRGATPRSDLRARNAFGPVPRVPPARGLLGSSMKGRSERA